MVTLETYKEKFNVPFEWLEQITVDEYNFTVDEFLSEYTWDDAARIKDKAKEEGVLNEL